MSIPALQVNQDQEGDVQQDQEDDVQNIEYMGEVLGRDVVIQLQLADSRGEFRPFLGTVREMKANLDEDGVVELDVQHCVWFQDGDKLWFDLATLKSRNY